MAMIWPSVQNQSLYPVTFTFNRTGDPTTYSFHIIYSLLVFVMLAVLYAKRRRIGNALFDNGKAIALFGVMGSLGIVLVSQCDFSSTLSTLLIGVGVSFVALYLPVHFIFWGIRLTSEDPISGAVDISLSFILICLVNGIRLTLGIHALEVSVAFPLISAVLGYMATKQSSGNHPTKNGGLRDLSVSILVPCVVFVYICAIGTLLFNGSSALSVQPPNRNVLYFADALLFAIIIFVLVFAAKDSRTRLIDAFAVLSVFFVGSILVASFISTDTLSAGSVPLIASSNAFEVFIWIIIITDCSRKHLSPITLAVLYLAFVIMLPRFLSACIMYQGGFLAMPPDSFVLFGLTCTSAFVVSAVVIVCLMRFLAQAMRNAEAAKAPDDKSLDAACLALQEKFGLSNREIEIVKLALDNQSAKQIAEELFIAESTVYTHFKRIYRKTDVHSKQELVGLVSEFQRDAEATARS